ncbi:MAG: hypothetical protein KGO82_10160 [Bacteroidota bacterium]|nr:hypothetical protein [Bacteroidota bacterium]
MKPLATLLLLIAVCCAACKSTQKLYEQGQYDRAVYSALDDLRKRPENSTAASILPQAYNEAQTKYENSIAAAQNGSVTAQKLDLIYRDYLALQKMYDAIAATPAAFSHVNARNYNSELSAAAEAAAEFRYNEGSEFLQRGDRLSARRAYENFQAVSSYIKGYRNVDELMARAYDIAIVNVIVDKFDQRFDNYSINGAYFQNDIVSRLNSIGNSHYYRFFNFNEPRAREVRADQFMDINVYDIWFGQMAVNRDSYTVTKDITEKDPKDEKKTRTTTVSATVNVTRRVIDSRASMDYRIMDAASRQMVGSDRLFARYTWEKLTGSYTGDQRALSDKDWAIIRGAFNNQPTYDELYRELTRQLMNQFDSRVRSIYGR